MASDRAYAFHDVPLRNMTPEMRTTVKNIEQSDFAELRKRVTAAGLLKKDPYHFAWHFSLMTCLLFIGIAIICITTNAWIQILNALFLAFVFGQFGYIHHDAGHMQIFHKPWKNKLAGFTCAFLMGGSFTWWMDQHNQHHAHTNEEDCDPDIQIPILAYSENQARSKKGLAKLIVSRQEFFVFPIWALAVASMRITQTRYILTHSLKDVRIDYLTVFGNIVLYLWLLFAQLPPLTAIAFIVVHQLAWGFYLGSVFAPNHKGMEMFDTNTKPDFLRQQVLCSRNIHGNPVTDFLYGHLNYQIEHHLFPTMQRSRYAEAQKIVRTFCAEKGIPYHETSIIGSYIEIYRHMRSVSRFARG